LRKLKNKYSCDNITLF